jgi:hypothetical protein|uniref:Uncharacterized protein n=1 Tax=Podoviridae sp. ct1h53 TaxID=2826536 RepID=A0A8S5MGX1_9CAUD|nr:MAG TPA: hypothetical protein [Podoviridae sp. ct1h53]
MRLVEQHTIKPSSVYYNELYDLLHKCKNLYNRCYQKVEGFGGTRYGFPYKYIPFYISGVKWYIITSLVLLQL